jgi:hypothetical protein
VEDKIEKPVREIDPQITLIKAIAVLVMLAVSITGLCYAIWLLCTLPAKK